MKTTEFKALCMRAILDGYEHGVQKFDDERDEAQRRKTIFGGGDFLKPRTTEDFPSWGERYLHVVATHLSPSRCFVGPQSGRFLREYVEALVCGYNDRLEESCL